MVGMNGKLFILACLGITIFVVALVMTADHWWRKLGGVQITYNGQFSNTSSVFRSPDGELLILVGEEGEGSLYVVRPDSEVIGMPDRSSFVFLPAYAYSKRVPPLIALMQSAKIEVDPELIIQPQFIEFNSFGNARVRLTW